MKCYESKIKLVSKFSLLWNGDVNSEHSVHIKKNFDLAKILIVPIDSAYKETPPSGGQLQKGIIQIIRVFPITLSKNFCTIKARAFWLKIYYNFQKPQWGAYMFLWRSPSGIDPQRGVSIYAESIGTIRIFARYIKIFMWTECSLFTSKYLRNEHRYTNFSSTIYHLNIYIINWQQTIRIENFEKYLIF